MRCQGFSTIPVNTSVCEVSTPLDGAGVFNVPTPLPSF